MSVSVKIESHTAEVAGSGESVASAVQGEIQHIARLEAPPYFDRKALAARVLGVLLLIPASPLIALIVILVRYTTPGPGLFRQVRVGKGGREFMMYKIRTMYQDAEKATGAIWCKPADSRITCVGKVLRFLHLDELPQLINIVRGEMALIGPRPERPEIVPDLLNDIPLYMERLAVLPGVTGLSQINLPPDESFDCVRRKLVFDLEYIATASLGLDIRILLCTAMRMIGVRHGYAVRLLGLEYKASDDSLEHGRELQSDIARSAWQSYRLSRERSLKGIFITKEAVQATTPMLSHAECLRLRPDVTAEEEGTPLPLPASLTEVTRTHPK